MTQLNLTKTISKVSEEIHAINSNIDYYKRIMADQDTLGFLKGNISGLSPDKNITGGSFEINLNEESKGLFVDIIFLEIEQLINTRDNKIKMLEIYIEQLKNNP